MGKMICHKQAKNKKTKKQEQAMSEQYSDSKIREEIV